MSDKSSNGKSFHPAKPLIRSHMPCDFSISLEKYTSNRSVRFPSDFGLYQELSGFDPTYKNIVDYIVRITHRIWETDRREVEYIGETYSEDSRVFDDYGLQLGSKKIISDTYHTTGAFPDIILDAEEVIWAGDDKLGFHTSHLTRIIGTNTGVSRYGDPTNKKINVMVIANCIALENQIFHEHVLYNTSAMLQQLDIDLWKEAERLVNDPPAGWPRSTEVWSDLRTSASPKNPLHISTPVHGFDPDRFAREVHYSIWNGDIDASSKYYSTTVQFEGTTNRLFEGFEAYRSYVEEVRTAFPDLNLQVDEVYWIGNEDDGWLISTRWSADGTHLGASIYKEPTGGKCQLWGITQWRVRSQIIEAEWQLFNEFDLIMQITRAREHQDFNN